MKLDKITRALKSVPKPKTVREFLVSRIQENDQQSDTTEARKRRSREWAEDNPTHPQAAYIREQLGMPEPFAMKIRKGVAAMNKRTRNAKGS